MSTAGSFRTSQEQHRALLTALRAGDAEAATDVLRAHLGDTEEIVARGIASAET